MGAQYLGDSVREAFLTGVVLNLAIGGGQLQLGTELQFRLVHQASDLADVSGQIRPLQKAEVEVVPGGVLLQALGGAEVVAVGGGALPAPDALQHAVPVGALLGAHAVQVLRQARPGLIAGEDVGRVLQYREQRLVQLHLSGAQEIHIELAPVHRIALQGADELFQREAQHHRGAVCHGFHAGGEHLQLLPGGAEVLRQMVPLQQNLLGLLLIHIGGLGALQPLGTHFQTGAEAADGQIAGLAHQGLPLLEAGGLAVPGVHNALETGALVGIALFIQQGGAQLLDPSALADILFRHNVEALHQIAVSAKEGVKEPLEAVGVEAGLRVLAAPDVLGGVGELLHLLVGVPPHLALADQLGLKTPAALPQGAGQQLQSRAGGGQGLQQGGGGHGLERVGGLIPVLTHSVGKGHAQIGAEGEAAQGRLIQAVALRSINPGEPVGEVVAPLRRVVQGVGVLEIARGQAVIQSPQDAQQT